MSFLDDIAEEFDPETQVNGNQDYTDGKVTILSIRDHRIVGRVQGDESHKVTIAFGPDRIDGKCTCTAYRQFGPCQHIWAVALAADDQGLVVPAEPVDEAVDVDSALPVLNSLLEQMVGFELASRGRVDSSVVANAPPAPAWKRHVDTLRLAMRSAEVPVTTSPSKPPLAGKQLVYVIHAAVSRGDDGAQLNVDLCTVGSDRSSKSAKPRPLRLTHAELARLPAEEDRILIQMLTGVDSRYYSRPDDVVTAHHTLRGSEYDILLRRMCDTGRCLVRTVSEGVDEYHPISWDDGPPWELVMQCRLSPGGSFYHLKAILQRGEEQMECREPLLVQSAGLLITRKHATRLSHFGAFPMLLYFRRCEKLKLARADADAALVELLSMSPLPRLDLAEELSVRTVRPQMKPRLMISAPPKRQYGDDHLLARLSFGYDGKYIDERAEVPMFDPETRVLLHRDSAAESAARAMLEEMKVRESYDYYQSAPMRKMARRKLNNVVIALCAAGWTVEAQGKLYRRAGEFKMEVSSGIDWFDLNGTMDFDGVSASLPRLLAAAKRGEKTVLLDDGTMGILPEDWLRRYGLLANMAAKADEDVVRFTRGQIGLLDALLSDMPQSSCDEVFQTARKHLLNFDGIEPQDPKADFTGTLRPYQRQGLGWLNFLNRFRFGGCLADDMGLGKTVQVLALLDSRRCNGKPSLVVVPRSLIFNWIEEAQRFAPKLRILDHSGVGRTRDPSIFRQYDIILTTYGTLRLDAPALREMSFDYAILDEAQAIKNGSSESAKAARLIQADYRLAMSGTPVQNHLGELWSLFEFLNPGMLGGASIFKATGKGNTIEKEGREMLARALRPFILRRTKEQVAPELPEKTEQTIHCDMEPDQRKVYDELREHYRKSLLNRVATEGINKSKIQILEALLRLRQAACHPGLIDPSWIEKPAAKLDAMIPQLVEVIEEGHKVLVFSQFTSMLAIVKKHLDKQKIVYEYLDGQTRDRQAKVNRFQTDPDCRVFLISLKAGGLGLNLTAAEYVFLLDPWWNPAIEAQAIDRAHRIGQTQRVFAYRFIANDTVEQKVLELQSRKKDLADMIINADNSLIAQLGKEDLELLLS